MFFVTRKIFANTEPIKSTKNRLLLVALRAAAMARDAGQPDEFIP